MIGSAGLSFSGMGTKMQPYMMDLNVEMQHEWSPFNKKTRINGQFCNVSELSKVNGYSDIDLEILKQTILRQEAIFREQLHELNRLYKIQRDLMDELQSMDECSYPLPIPASNLNPISANLPPNSAAKTSPAYGLQAGNSSELAHFQSSQSTPYSTSLRANNGLNMLKTPYSMALGRDNGQPLFGFQKHTTNNYSSIPEENVCREWWGAKTGNCDRVTDTFELPAGRHVSGINGEKIKDWNLNMSVNDANLNLGKYKNLDSRESWKINLQAQHDMLDLNEPAREVCQEEGRENWQFQKFNLVLENVPNGIPQNRQKGDGTCSRFLRTGRRGEGQVWQLLNGQRANDADIFNLSSHAEKISTALDTEQFKYKKASWFGEKPNCSSTESDRQQCSTSTSYLGTEAPPTSARIPDFLVPPSRNPTNHMSDMPAVMQGFLCSSVSAQLDMQMRNSGTSIQSSSDACNVSKHEEGFVCRSSFGSQPSLDLNSPGLDLQCEPKDPNSNVLPTRLDKSNLSPSDSSSYGNHTGHGMNLKSKENLHFSLPPSNGFCTKSEGISWLVPPPVCVNGNDGNVHIDKMPVQSYVQMPLGETITASTQNNTTPCNGKKIFGFSICDESPSLPSSVTSKSDQYDVNGVNVLNSEKKMVSEGICGGGLRGEIDLNCSSIDNNQEKPQPVPSVQKCCSGFDLEVPAVPVEEDPTQQLGETSNVYVDSTELQTDKICDNEKAEGVREPTIVMVAEIIVAMSSYASRSSSAIVNCTLDVNSCDSLQLLADVVTSNINNHGMTSGEPRGKLDCNASSDLDDGMDFFESMTLKLTEMKVEKCHVRTHKENLENGETGLVSALLTKARKGQGKKRRQKRDFQKDILPGLSSLSRYEVTEDLQTIGGQMRALGQSWEAGASRKSSCGNGRNGQTRGRPRRSRATTVVVEISTETQSEKNNTIKSGIDPGAIISWGRTRRCRQQRCPSGNITAHLS